MDPSRIESYLRSTCSVLDFDIGELWCARKSSGGQKPLLKFIQLYTSPTYEDFHSLLVQPDHSSEQWSHDEDKHRFSPVICRGVCDGGQIVWANTRISQGLTGRIDLPLNTAVGVPICSIGSDLYILVLFAVGIISMTPSAVEFLVTVARAVADRSDGFLSASFLSNVSPVNSEDFVGVFDIADLIRKYSNDVEFHVLPMGKLQKFFDCHEILLFCDLFMDFKMSRDGRFTVKQLESLRDSFKSTRERSDSVSSIGSNKTWDLGSGDINSAHEVKAVLDSVIPNPRTQILPSSQHGGAAEDDIVALSSGEIGGSNLGMYNADLNSIEHELEVDVELNPQKNKFAKLELIENTLQGFGGGNDTNKSILHIYAHMTYKLSQCRFHEFMIAILGMTVFEAAELWLASERKSELVLVAAVYRTVAMHSWISLSETMRLKAGSDVPGRVVETGNSHWDHQYSQGSGADEPRAHAAREFGVHTAFGVPLPGVTGICGTIVFYSSKQDFQPQSLLIQLIEKAVQLMAASAVDTSWPRIEDSSTVGDFSVGPSVPLSRWLHSSTSDSGQNNLHSSVPTQSISNSSDQLPPLPYRKPSDFEQKLQICRTLVNGPRSSQHDLCGDCTSPPLKVAAVGADAFPASFYPPHYPGVVEFDPRILAHYSSMNMDNTPVGIIPEHEVTAAYTLANFGKVEWHSYLESSGITNDDGHQPAKIASTHDLELYEQPDRSNLKREHSSKSQASNISALPLCKVEGCTSAVENSAAQYCAAHRSTRRCQKEGCNKCAQGATKYCIAHGGGRRCTFPGCFKGARDKFFCAAHGGGKRCTFSGCTKSAVGGSNLCTAHGGGKRCQYPDCTKSSQSNTMYCVRHGGGRSCMYAGCTKVARGKTDYCAAHGGGVRCRIPNCNKLAVGGSLQLCRTHNTGGEQGIILDSSHGDYEDGESLQDELSLTRIQRSSSDHTEGEEPAAKKLKNA